jgi:hypothetical protein
VKAALTVTSFAIFDILTAVTINMEYGAMQSGAKLPNAGGTRSLHLQGRRATSVSIPDFEIKFLY